MVRTERLETGVAALLLDRPPLNILSRAMVTAGLAQVEALRTDPSLRVVIVGDAARRQWSAGADITEFLAARDAVGPKKLEAENRFMDALEALPVPTIAVVQGYALGGGLELALACDWIIAEDDARLGFPEISLGVFPGSGGVWRATRRIGAAKARYLMFGGEQLSASAALSWGLVDEVVAPGSGWDRARQLAKSWAARSAAALRATKTAVRFAETHGLTDTTDLVLLLSEPLFASDDVAQRVEAFLARRRSRSKEDSEL